MTHKRIIVAIDGSHMSKTVLEEALKLTKCFNAQLCVLHVADECVEFRFLHAKQLLDYQEAARKHAQMILEDMRVITQEHAVNAELRLVEITDTRCRIAEKIIAEALAWHADLIVIGTHGHRGWQHFLLGSVAEETIRISPMPVYIIRCQ